MNTNRHLVGSQNTGNKTPPITIVNYDQDVQDKYGSLTTRRAALQERLSQGKREQNKILEGLGELVATGAKYKPATDRLAALRLESEALELGIQYVNGQCGLLRRNNIWLKL